MPIKDFIHHYPRALFNDIPRVGAYFYDISGSGRTFTTYPGRDVLLRHTRVGAQLITIQQMDGAGFPRFERHLFPDYMSFNKGSYSI